jgi:hypothetical protein
MLHTNTASGLHDFLVERVLARYARPAGNGRILVVEAAP